MEGEEDVRDNMWRARLDAILMHKVWDRSFSWAWFISFSFLSFAIGDPLVRLIQTGTQMFSIWACCLLEPWPGLQSLLGEGVVGGVGGVLAFLPNVVLLFGAITVLEKQRLHDEGLAPHEPHHENHGAERQQFCPPFYWDSAVQCPPFFPPGGLRGAMTALSPSPYFP